MCHNKNEEEDENKLSFLYILKQTCHKKTILQTNFKLKVWFVSQAQTNIFVLGFAFDFVLAHEQAILQGKKQAGPTTEILD